VEPPAAGLADAYVLDVSMTGADCIAALSEAYDRATVELVPNRLWVSSRDVVLSCEVDEHA
jgi:hypothetical protein